MDKKALSLSLGLPAVFLLGSLARPVALQTHQTAALQQSGAVLARVSLAGVIGVVDFDRAFTSYAIASRMQKDLAGERTKTAKQLAEMKLRRKEVSDQAQGYTRFTDAWWERRQTVEALSKEIEVFVAVQNQRIVYLEQRDREKVFDAIETAIGKLVKATGLQMVFRQRHLAKGMRQSTRGQIRETRELIWAAKPLDVTDKVIKLMQ